MDKIGEMGDMGFVGGIRAVGQTHSLPGFGLGAACATWQCVWL